MPMLLTKWTFALISVNSLSTVLFVHALVHRKSTGDHHHHNPQSLLDNPKDDIHTEAAKMQAQASENQAPMSCPDGYKIEADDAKYLTCPPGRYLTQQGHEKARERLLNVFCLAKSQGQVGGNARETDFYKARGYATFESSLWPKSDTCQRLPDEGWNGTQQPGLHYRVDEVPQWSTKLVNTKFKAEFHKIWKVASSSFPDYLLCALGDWEIVPVPEETPQGTKAVTAVREPIDRWISGMGELLRRSIDHICPVGRACSSEIDWFEPSTTLPDLRHTTTWYQVIEAGFKSSKLAELVAAFVHDTQCNFHYYSAEHFSTQTLMTQNNGTAQDQDLLIKLEDSEDGLKRFHEIFGGNAECKLEHLNAAAKKTGEHKIPDRNDILHKLQGNDELMRALCAVYAQDFICFSYDLPRACKGMF
mmetsp:Transcript_81798/g.149478  ORF Transcript_81798/g.149478 Transcript_81798/m.149478 type:complete len:418 (-) Transcript_81798:49-1302(-)